MYQRCILQVFISELHGLNSQPEYFRYCGVDLDLETDKCYSKITDEVICFFMHQIIQVIKLFFPYRNTFLSAPAKILRSLAIKMLIACLLVIDKLERSSKN